MLVHFVKDFGMPGFQVGCLVTRCQPIKDYMINKSGIFQQPASYVRQMLTVMINDRGNVVLHSQYTAELMIMASRDGTIQGTGVSMHHAKSITIPRYITTLEHFYDQYLKAMI